MSPAEASHPLLIHWLSAAIIVSHRPWSRPADAKRTPASIDKRSMMKEENVTRIHHERRVTGEDRVRGASANLFLVLTISTYYIGQMPTTRLYNLQRSTAYEMLVVQTFVES